MISVRKIGSFPGRIIAVLMSLLVLSACSVVGQSQPTMFYVMSEVGNNLPADKKINLPQQMHIGVGPIDIPGYSDRPQMVTVGNGAQLKVSDLDHWAEPVQGNIERILVGNLSSLINSQQVFAYPANFHPSPDSLQISVEISDMIQTESGLVRLSASWNIKRLRDNVLISRQSKSYQIQQQPGDYAAFATSLSTLFGSLSVDMAQSIKTSR